MVAASSSPFRRILVAVDATEVSEHAAAVAHRLFGDTAQYVLVSVASASSPSAQSSGTGTVVGDPLVVAHAGTPAPPGDDTRELLDVVAARAQLDHPRELEATGEVSTTILETAHDQLADVIVVGSHDRNWFARALGASTSRHVTGGSDRPVLIVKPPHGRGPSSDVLNVIVATDGSPASLLSARTASELFGANAHYEVVHVAAERPDPNADATGFAGPILTEEEADDIERESLVRGSAAVAETARSIGRVPVTETVLVGDPVVMLCARADELPADVVVVGSTGTSRLLHVLLGSVSSRVVSHCDVPVLVVPHPVD